MATLGVLCGRDIGSVPESCSRDVRASVPPSDKASQCTLLKNKGEETQTDHVTLCSAGCQTEAAFPDPSSESEVHLTETGITCKTCRQSFPQVWNARRHWRLHHSREPPGGPHKPYYCPHCSFCHLTRKLVRVHERTHPEAGPRFSAQSCPRRSTRNCPQKTNPRAICKIRPRLARETMTDSPKTKHTRTTPQVSDVSPKSCVCEKDADTDTVVRTTIMPFECEICQKRFSFKERLFAHTINHMSNKLFECEICLQGFVMQQNLTAHMKQHTVCAAKVYSCSTCGESFSHKVILTDHEKKPHISVGSERPYECIVCHEFFPQRAGLLDHHCTSILSRMVEASLETASLKELE